MKLIRGSELQDFLRCRLRWKYAWVDELQPKKVNDKLFIGTLIHKWLEVFYETKDIAKADSTVADFWDSTDLSDMEQTEISELDTLSYEITRNYYNHWKAADEKLTVVATELQFMIPLTEEVAYTGTIDLIYKDEYGNMWFMDHKTTASIDKYEKNSYMDRQISRYWWALQQLTEGKGYIRHKFEDKELGEQWVKPNSGIIHLNLKEPFGFQYNLILKDFPVPPKVLKSGGLSKAKNQKTTIEMYVQALHDLGLYTREEDSIEIEFPEEYQEILDHLAEQEDRYFKRVTVHRTQEEINASMQEFWATSLDLQKVKNILDKSIATSPVIYRNITSDCQWDCSFKDICVAGMDGSDVDYLKEELFKRRES